MNSNEPITRNGQVRLEDLTIRENAYFYRKLPPFEPLSTTIIDTLFKEASAGKISDHFLFKEISTAYLQSSSNAIAQLDRENSVEDPSFLSWRVSACIFSYERKPSFIETANPDFFERKLGYLVILDGPKHLVISKRNAKSFIDLIPDIEPLEYQEITKAFYQEDTPIEKMQLRSILPTSQSIHQKILESPNLRNNIGPLSANSFAITSLRLASVTGRLSISSSTSRINKFGKSKAVQELIDWAADVIDIIEAFTGSPNFLDSFAEPINYQKERDNLVPKFINVFASDLKTLFEEIDEVKIVVRLRKKDGSSNKEYFLEREIDAEKIFTNMDRVLDLIHNPQKGHWKIESNQVNDAKIKLNKKSISISSPKLKRIIIMLSDGTEENLLSLIKKGGYFQIFFEAPEYSYTQNRLFRSNKLLGNIESFLDTFRTYNQLKVITSEKGSIQPHDTTFPISTVFNFIDAVIGAEFDHFICDDLGNEWADFIGIGKNKVSFFHAKQAETKYSASKFQEVIGQALKNLGNMRPSQAALSQKAKSWDSKYSGSQIDRIRKSSSGSIVASDFYDTANNPNSNLEVAIVVDFLSKDSFREWLAKLKNREDFREKKEVVQMLWFFSTYIAACHEASVTPLIYCKP